MTLADERRALAEMYIDLTLALHRVLLAITPQTPPPEIDANVLLVGVVAALGHAEGHAKNASEIATRLNMPRTSARNRLKILTNANCLILRDGRYYLPSTIGAADRAAPPHDSFELILAKAFAVLVPHLAKLAT